METENAEIKLLNVGDIIYTLSHGILVRRRKVTDVTKTRAKCGDESFKRDYTKGISAIGEGVYSHNYYELETKELKEKFDHILLVNKVSKIHFSTLSTEKLQEIFKIAQ